MAPEIVMAPLLGYTDLLYRRTFKRHFQGVDRYLAPFLSLSENSVPKTITRTFDRDDEPQILGNHPETLYQGAKKLFQCGFPVVNLNLGCPVAAVARKKRGSGLLPHPGLIRQCLEALHRPGLPLISVKIRLGRNSADESPGLLDVLNDFPLKEIIVHPRIGTQLYLGTPSIEDFKYFSINSKRPVSWSGDLNSVSDYKKLILDFPHLKAVFLGRGLCGDPFLAEKIMGIAQGDKTCLRFKLFFEDLLAQWSENSKNPLAMVNKLKGFWEYPLASMSWAKDLWLPFKLAKTMKELEKFIDVIFLRWLDRDNQEMGPFDVSILRREGMEKAG